MININNKPWERLRFSDIEKLLSVDDDETFFFEFKSDEESPAKLIKEVSAFSNTYGGYILLGVNDDKTIGGCTKWTEQRIHATIHDSITPVPDFDVKMLKSKDKTVLVIKIEEGNLPPYITNKGQIFERISSGSFPINNSEKLSQLYTKRQDQLIRTKDKIELEQIRIDATCPNNLCGYLDLGFSTTFSEITSLQKTFYVYDFDPISKYLKSTDSRYSISRLGHSILISIGEATATSGENKRAPLNSGVNNFIEIMCDGSVRSRIILTAVPGNTKVEISTIVYLRSICREIYAMIFGKSLAKKFIYAQKYERLTVIKQFVPFYDIKNCGENQLVTMLNNYLPEHRERYGNNLMIENSRLPKSDYFIIDKRWFNAHKLKYNADSIIQELFRSEYTNLGFVDAIKDDS